MVTKRARRSRRPKARSRYATAEDVREIHRILALRAERLDELQHTCTVHFQRIAQIQAELDEVKTALAKMTPGAPRVGRWKHRGAFPAGRKAALHGV
jgi:hypothetical protein